MTVAEFYAKRTLGENQFFDNAGGNGKTILLSSHIYWTDLIGLALLRMGYNVIFAAPWYGFWISDHLYENFDALFNEWVGIIRQHKVCCIIGGNTTAMVIHPKTGEPLHRAAGVPIIHYWWDEPRGAPPMSRRGITLRQYVDLMKDDRTLNVIWDADIREELETYLGLTNSVHVLIAQGIAESLRRLRSRRHATAAVRHCLGQWLDLHPLQPRAAGSV